MLFFIPYDGTFVAGLDRAGDAARALVRVNSVGVHPAPAVRLGIAHRLGIAFCVARPAFGTGVAAEP